MKTKINPALGFILMLAGLTGTGSAHAASPPAVANVTAAQRAGSKLVDIHYDLSYAGTNPVSIFILVSANAGATWDVPASTFGGDYGPGINPGAGKAVIWNAGADWNGQFTTTCRVRITAFDGGISPIVTIPGGSYIRGDALDGDADAPVYLVNVSQFYIESYLVTGSLWNTVREYAIYPGHYTFTNNGSYKSLSHPAYSVNWFDAVKWCNARSELDGRTPVYYTDAGFTTVYKSGQVVPYVKPGVNGWRLPTEAEWEKAARGGLSGKRFPWGDTITHNQANYYSYGLYAYDTSTSRGDHPTYTGTSPVASFPANNYGLFDMAGNVSEWCYDWYGSTYYAAGQTDPQGPSSGTYRILRGHSRYSYACYTRCAYRYYFYPNADVSNVGYFGFRCVREL